MKCNVSNSCKDVLIRPIIRMPPSSECFEIVEEFFHCCLGLYNELAGIVLAFDRKSYRVSSIWMVATAWRIKHFIKSIWLYNHHFLQLHTFNFFSQEQQISRPFFLSLCRYNRQFSPSPMFAMCKHNYRQKCWSKHSR